MSTESVLEHHLEAFAEGDIDATMSDYTEDSVVLLPDKTLRGLREIRAAFGTYFAGLFEPGTYEFTMDRAEVVGDVAYIVWHSANRGAVVGLGTDTFVIRNGKIAVQTFAARVEER